MIDPKQLAGARAALALGAALTLAAGFAPASAQTTTDDEAVGQLTPVEPEAEVAGVGGGAILATCAPGASTPVLSVAGEGSSAMIDATFDGDTPLADCLSADQGSYVGFVDPEPAALLDLATDADMLRVEVESFRTDTTLAVVTPDGEVFFNDDGDLLFGGEGELRYGSSIVRIPNATAGAYVIFTGVYDTVEEPGIGRIMALSEDLSCPDAREPAAQTVSMGVERRLAAAQVSGLTGDASLCPGLPQVFGSLPEAATVEVELTEAAPFLVIGVESSDFDTTLLVEGPFGQLEFNDDRGDGTLNSEVVLENADAGSYRVYVGTYQFDASGDVLISMEATDSIPCLDAAAAPTAFMATPSATGLAEIRESFAIDGTYAARDCPGFGDFSLGFYEGPATYGLDIAPGDVGRSITLEVTAGADATLLVRTPSGLIHFNDDGAGRGLDPLITFTPEEPGLHLVWVGGYGSGFVAGDMVLREN